MAGWPEGVWQTRAPDRLHLVVLCDLPEDPGTLLLRLLGRGRTMQRALQELIALPVQHMLRVRALPVMVAFRAPILQDLERTGDMNALQQAQALYDELVQHERREGHAEGLRKGRKEGRKEEARALLVRLLTRRFGSLPGPASARVQRAGTATLERWAERVLTARSLDEVFD